MKTLLQLAEEWRTDFRENPGGSADCASSGCADELEAWVRELASELDKAEADQKASRVMSLGPLSEASRIASAS